jgi:hypothetical protein
MNIENSLVSTVACVSTSPSSDLPGSESARYRAYRTTEPWKEPSFKCSVLTLALAERADCHDPVLQGDGSSLTTCSSFVVLHDGDQWFFTTGPP